jgi:hypothetical protein
VVPIALLLSLALAVGVWIVPMPFLEAKPVEVSVPEVDATRGGGDAPSDEAVRIESKDWTALRASLSAIRPAPPAEEEDEPDADDEESETGDEQAPEEARFEHLPPLTWTYDGYIAQPNGRIVAWMNIDGLTRAVYEGDRLEDTVDPRQREVLVKSVTREAVTLRRAGKDVVIELEDPQRTNVGDPTEIVPN